MSSWQDELGQRWALRASALDRQLRPVHEVGVAAVNAHRGERVLDIGCGAGASSRMLADLVAPTGHVTGVYISPAQIEEARRRSRSDLLELVVCDAESHE